YKEVGERVFSKFFENIALFGYYTGGKRLPEPHKGDILVVAFDKGWFWYIPLSDTLTSVGAVFSSHLAYKLKGSHEATLQEFIDECPMIKEYLSEAERVTEGIYGEVRVRKDYSYCNTRFWEPGLALIGDVACFIDPILSTGVHLTTYAALQVARSINTCLRNDADTTIDEQQCFEEFETRYRAEYARFYQFLVAFYDTNRNKDSYFWTARNMLNSKERGNGAFVKLISGVADGMLHDNAAGFFDSRADTGMRVQSWMSAMQGDVQQERVETTVDDYSDSYCMIPGFETVSMQSAGLVPSADGFHWQANVANETNGHHANGTNGHHANGTNGHHVDTDAQAAEQPDAEELELTL
ncbi:MAG: tryptophan 7-halogenase, partial [Caldilineaceae bacterium]|nr:tryptophan 7-halogenase [Caldilineaceae bacterium]